MQTIHTPSIGKRIGLIYGALMLCACAVAAEEIVEIEDVSDRELETEAFRLRHPMTLHVRCEGAGEGDEESMYAYGWILNTRTRQVEWALTMRNSRSGKGNNRVFEGEIDLPEGKFVAYYTVYWSGHYKTIEFLGKKIARIWIDSDRHKSPREMRNWGLRVETLSEADADDVVDLYRMPDIGDDSDFVKLVRMGDDEFETVGFTLPERMRIKVYCQGEFVSFDDGAVDQGWILNLATRKRVWELAPGNFKHGGGAFKNKVSREIITLPAGNYTAGYSTDGSHSAEGWNAPPPYDPEAWGLLLSALSVEDARKIRPYQEQEDTSRTIVSLINQRDGAYASRGIRVKRPIDVRVYAIGEYDDSNHEFADHGWVEDFNSASTVWKMKHDNSRHAGGASKNLAADEIISLKPGDYVVYYVSDNSHAYGEWNAPPPHDPTHWGITLFAAGDFDQASIETFNPDERLEKNQDYLARLVRVRDDEHVRQKFRLDKPTRVRILAVGEGLFSEMADYGWIEDADSGDWIWEMTWRNTTHAGGARKNRKFDSVIMLDRGEYEANYVTDGSHAWGEWNQPRPREPHNYGITIIKLDN